MSKIKFDKDIVIGASTSFLDCTITEMFSSIGYDYVWIDSEHSALTKKDVMHHIIALKRTKTASFVRVPWNDPVLVKPILEFAPDGIIFPFIKNATEAKKAVKACSYPPKGIRGYGPRRANNYGMRNESDYIKNADNNFWTIIQIEHIEAVKNLHKILEVDGVDAIMVGPKDLSGSINLLGETNHKEVKKLMDEIGEISSNYDKPLGAVVGNDINTAKEWIDRGAEWLRVGHDLSLIKKASLEILESIDKINK